MRIAAAILSIALLAAEPAHAALVDVIVTGQVSFNTIDGAPLDGVETGTDVTMSFTVDSNTYFDGIPGVTRSYVIDKLSFTMNFDVFAQVGLQDPFPNGTTPYFTLANGFPSVDEFFVSTSPYSPHGVPLEQEPLQVDFDVAYGADTLSSVDILDAQGTYDLDGLVRYTFDLWKLTPSAVVMGIDFESMTIRTRTTVPVPAALWLFASGLLGLRGWRRRG